MNAQNRHRHQGNPEETGPIRRLANRVFPFLPWFDDYSLSVLGADVLAGVTVALILIPQSMAYAQLADLPAYFGLYAAFLPPLVAALFGSSRQLATGPVAVVSLMTSTALAPLATAGSEEFIAYAVILAFLVGVFQFLLGVLRLGIVVNFLSHPVVNGFTNAAAIIIATSQLPKLLGVEVDKAEHHYETVYRTVEAALRHLHWPTFLLGLLAFAIIIVLKRLGPRLPNVLLAVIVTTIISLTIGLEQERKTTLGQIRAETVREFASEYNANLEAIQQAMARRVVMGQALKGVEREHGTHSVEVIELHAEQAKLDVTVEKLKEKGGQLRATIRELRFAAVPDSAGSLAFYLPGGLPAGSRPQGRNWQVKIRNDHLAEDAITMVGGGAVVGRIPGGLPAISPPRIQFGIMRDLVSMAIIISLLGFMEAISIAKAMANRTGQRLDPNQELIGQGLANILGSFTHSYPVSGSFSRSAVNIQAGAVTGMSSVFSSLVVLITLLFFTPLLYHLPQSVLAAIIMMAVVGLINIRGFVHAWRAQRHDGIIAVISFVCTLAFAPHLDKGILIGVVLSLGLYLFRNMRPETAVLSRAADGHYRSADRWGLENCRHVAVIRLNCSLIFANVNYLEVGILREVSARPELKHLLLVGNGINELDASGEVMLSFLVSKLRSSGIDISFSGLNDQVLDVLKRTQLQEKIGEDHFFNSVEQAVQSIHRGVCIGTGEADCPLLRTHALPEPGRTTGERRAGTGGESGGSSGPGH